jgi:hypothetical protein
MKVSDLNSRPVSRTVVYCSVTAVAVLAEYEYANKKILYRNNQRNSIFCHMEKGLEIKPFRPRILNKFNGADVR